MRPTLALFLLTAICFSCKKEGKKPNEGTVLTKVETRYDDGNRSSRTFERNSSDNITLYRDWLSASGAAGSVSMEYENGKVKTANYLDNAGHKLFHFEFEYNANGTVSKRYTKPDFVNLADDYNLYVYDVAGKLIADSAFSRVDQTKPYVISVVTAFTYTGMNITEAQYYRNISGVLTLEYRTKYEYDTGINPYRDLNNYYYVIEGNSAMYDIKFISANTVKKDYFANGNGTFAPGATITYQYNSSNYPWKSKAVAFNGDEANSEFFYE